MFENYFNWVISLPFVMLLIIVVVHFIPTIIAFSRDHPSRWAIFIVNLFFGFTGLGWIIALIWSLIGVRR